MILTCQSLTVKRKVGKSLDRLEKSIMDSMLTINWHFETTDDKHERGHMGQIVYVFLSIYPGPSLTLNPNPNLILKTKTKPKPYPLILMHNLNLYPNPFIVTLLQTL